MGRYTVAILQYGIYPHAACFEDVALATKAALIDLGHECVDHTHARPGRLLMYGAGNMVDPDGQMPKDAILFNAEQLAVFDDPTKQIQGHEYFKNRVVWDYSAPNAETLRGMGFKHVVHCPIGYHPSMTKFESKADAEKDVDVLWYGSLSQRRIDVLEALYKTGLRVGRLDKGFYGAKRDECIARAKVVLNMHFYDKGVFEIFRCSHLFANRKCVVSEAGGLDSELEALAERTTKYVPVDKIVDTCVEMVCDDAERHAVEERGFAEFSKTSMVENVRRALEQS